VQTFLPATEKTQREHNYSLRNLIGELSVIALRLIKFVWRKVRFCLWLTGFVFRAVSRTLRLRKIWAVTLYFLAGFGAFFVLIVVSWHFDKTTTVASNPVKPAVISSADTQKKNQTAQYANCSFGQTENLKAGKCEWTATWEHSDKGEFFKDVAEARLTRIGGNLRQGQTTTALKALEPLLVNGNPGAQRIAGLMHLYGRGVSKDRQKALQLLELSAKQSDAKAQFLLGDLLIKDCQQKCPELERALPLFHAAHKSGVPEATEALAKIHLMGIGVDRDAKRALPFIKAAAEAGQARSQRILGIWFANGDHIPESAELAVKWLEKAAKQGDEVAMVLVGVHHILGEGVTRDIQDGFSWLWLSANSQHPRAQFVMGEALYSGDFGPQHKLQGLMWLKIAQRNGSEEAKEALIDRQEMLSREENLIADLMADDCLVEKKCGSPPWEWQREAQETRL
jgi:TPR repeat protein